MNILKFEEDAIITRSEPNINGDRSFQGDKMLFVGVETGMIVLIKLEELEYGEIIKLEMDWWSEGWGFYPQTLLDKAISKCKELAKNTFIKE